MKRYYDEEDDYDRHEDDRREERRRPVIRPLTGLDYALAGGLFAAAVALLSVWAFPGLNPDTWADVTEAAGLRPASAIFPGFWRAICRGVFRLADLAAGGGGDTARGVNAGICAMQILGRLAAGASVALVYLLFRAFLTLTVRGRLDYSRRRFVVIRGAAALGAAAFLCADPVWRMGQTFSPSGLLLLLSVYALHQFFSFLQFGRMAKANAAMFLLGLLAADTPFGFVLLAFCWGVYFLAIRYNAVSGDMPLFDPIVEQVAKWRLTFLWAVGLVAGVAANVIAFNLLDGAAANGVSGGDIPLLYATNWWTQFTGAASPFGWVLSLGVCVLPFVVALAMLPQAVDEERFLPYHVGAVFFVTGALALMQVAELPPLWYWTWHADISVRSYFLQMMMLLSSATVVFALAVMGVDSLCRDHARLAKQRFAELHEDEDLDDRAPAPRRDTVVRARRTGRVVAAAAALLLLAAMVPGRRLASTRAMLSVIEDYANEVVAECGPVHYIFTDGSFDGRLELAAAAQGKKLRALSMMSGPGAYERYVRQDGAADMEDRLALGVGAPMALRTWMRDKPDRMRDAAIQLGFEVWKRNGLELPVCSGVLARPLGMSPEDCEKGVAAAKAIADRILAFYTDHGGPAKSAGRKINDLFLFVQWRIARLARMRAERADRAGDKARALADVKLSDELDNRNSSLKQILIAMERARATALKQVTPREGLQLALARADFALARRHAEPILDADPDDPNANFAMGMSYYVNKQWTRAEEYLKRCLVRNPKEPAVWNNLAMLMMYTERFDEAEKHAARALELIPESAEVKDTIKQIREARAKAEEEKAKAAADGEKDGGQKKAS